MQIQQTELIYSVLGKLSGEFGYVGHGSSQSRFFLETCLFSCPSIKSTTTITVEYFQTEARVNEYAGRRKFRFIYVPLNTE